MNLGEHSLELKKRKRRHCHQGQMRVLPVSLPWHSDISHLCHSVSTSMHNPAIMMPNSLTAWPLMK